VARIACLSSASFEDLSSPAFFSIAPASAKAAAKTAPTAGSGWTSRSHDVSVKAEARRLGGVSGGFAFERRMPHPAQVARGVNGFVNGLGPVVVAGHVGRPERQRVVRGLWVALNPPESPIMTRILLVEIAPPTAASRAGVRSTPPKTRWTLA